MQDAMSLTRTLKLDATRQRRTHLYASDRARLEDAVAACDPPGDVRAALQAFGLRLDDALLGSRWKRLLLDVSSCTSAATMRDHSEPSVPTGAALRTARRYSFCVRSAGLGRPVGRPALRARCRDMAN